jgi:hypothetical protein
MLFQLFHVNPRSLRLHKLDPKRSWGKTNPLIIIAHLLPVRCRFSDVDVHHDAIWLGADRRLDGVDMQEEEAWRRVELVHPCPHMNVHRLLFERKMRLIIAHGWNGVSPSLRDLNLSNSCLTISVSPTFHSALSLHNVRCPLWHLVDHTMVCVLKGWR